MTASAESNLSNKIWITAKCRMNAEVRYKHYDLISNILVAAASVIVIGINIFQGILKKDAPVSEYTICLAIFILVTSLIVYSLGFAPKAILHRECYLKLQRLNDNLSDTPNAHTEYRNIVDAYPNHSEFDFYVLISKQQNSLKQPLIDSTGQIKNVTCGINVRRFIHFVFVYLLPPIVTVLAILPVFLLWL